MKLITFPPDVDINNRTGTVKFGIDPTANRLHLGHLIPLKILKQFQSKGNNIVLIIGDFTATLGDPSGKDATRPILTLNATRQNAQELIPILERILGKVSVRFNSEWLENITLNKFSHILSQFTIHELLSRDSFQNRIANQNPIGSHELIVPILQGLDSVEVNADIEIGGTDQLFNFQMSRTLQELNGQVPQICIFAPILNGLDGRKMSKSFNNCIWLDDSPKDCFGKTMSISDELMFEWLPIFCDNFNTNDHPMELKKQLAHSVTAEIWSKDDADIELERFINVFQKKTAVPLDIAVVKSTDLIDFVSKARGISNGSAKKLINSGAVSVNGTKIYNASPELNDTIIRIGKKDFFLFQWESIE